ncbi:MAG: DUF1049 domain-containing protein [Deltaproteobacteria bacterium]|nr:DUF1049 domain-containing protein [Deltaproteobacteria bacterium]MBI3387543.1 DUF1049 domain-containing protein [Deltaproteobacteria bacterium]
MRRAKIIAALSAVLLLVILAFQNPLPVEFKFLWMAVQVPKIMLMVISAVVGAVATLIVQYALRSSQYASRASRSSAPNQTPPTSASSV